MVVGIFKNDRVYEEIKNKGYATLNKVNHEKVENLKAILGNYKNNLNFIGGISISLLLKNKQLRREIHYSIIKELDTFLKSNFTDFKVPIAHFFSKKPGGNKVELHQDPMITLQNQQLSFGLWLPLQETTKTNGCVWVFPKSHLMFSKFQTDFPPFEYENALDDIMKKMIPIELEKGQALIMDNRLLHYSTENKGDFMRTGVVIKITHKGAALFTCYPFKGKRYILKQMDDFYLNKDWVNGNSYSPNGKLAFIIDGPTKPLIRNEVLSRIETKNNINTEEKAMRLPTLTEKLNYTLTKFKLFKNFSIFERSSS